MRSSRFLPLSSLHWTVIASLESIFFFFEIFQDPFEKFCPSIPWGSPVRYFWVELGFRGRFLTVRPGSTNIGAYLSLGPFSTIIGTYFSTRPISTIFLGLILYLNKFWVLLLYEAHFYYPWVLLLHEAHFYYPWVLFLHEAHLDNSSNFSNFPLTKIENLPQYVALNKFF